MVDVSEIDFGQGSQSFATEDFIASLIAPVPSVTQPSKTSPAFNAPAPVQPVQPPPKDIPPFKGPDIAGQLAALTAQGQAIIAQQNANTQQIPNPQGAYNAFQSAVEQKIQGEKMLFAEQQRQKAEVERRDAQVQLALGNSLLGGGKALDIAAEIAATTKDILAKDVALGQKMSVGFFDNPMQWLSNQFGGGAQEARALLNEEVQVDRRQAILDTFVKTSDDLHKLNQYATVQDQSKIIQAQSMIIEGGERQKLLAAQLEVQRTLQGGINVRNATLGQQWQIVKSLNDATTQSTHDSIALYDLSLKVKAGEERTYEVSLNEYRTALATREANQTSVLKGIQADQEAMRSSDIAKAQVAKSHLDGLLAKASTLLNIPLVTTDTFPFLPTNIKEILTSTMLIQDPGSQAMYGKDPVDSLRNLEKMPVGLAGGSEYTKQRLLDVRMEAVKLFGGEQGYRIAEQADKAGADHKLNNRMIAIINEQMKAIPDKDSIFSPNPLAAISKMASLGGNPIIEAMQPLLKSEPNHPLRAQEAFDMSLKLVQDGKLTLDQATMHLVQIYDSALQDTQQRNRLSQFGMQGLNTQTGFRVNVRTGLPFVSGIQNVDMTNQAAVLSALTRASLSSQVPLLQGGM